MDKVSQDLQKAWDERMEMHNKANKLFDEGAKLDTVEYEKFMRGETEVRQYPGEALKSKAMELKGDGDWAFEVQNQIEYGARAITKKSQTHWILKNGLEFKGVTTNAS